jgi:iron complex transport system substrate-binding protein
VVGDDGYSTEIPDEPRSIVSLTPANTEIVFTLGAGDLLKGGTDSDTYPPEAADLPDVVQGIEVLTEQIVDLDPDLVLAGGNNFTPPDKVQALRDLGINVLVVYPESVDEVLDDIQTIGEATGLEESATGIVDGMRARLEEVANAIELLDRPLTFYEIGYGPDIYGPAPNSFVADMVNRAGGDPVTTTDPASFTISLERLVDLDPDVIVLGDAAYGVCPQDLVTRPGWVGITAVSDGQVRPVDDLVVTLPGPRLGEGLAALALAIHPDAELSPPQGVNDYCPTPD